MATSLTKKFTNWTIIKKRPCEKVSYFFALTLATTGYLGYMIYTGKMTFPEHYLILSVLGAGAGYVGVLYYRIMHKKKPYFIFNFWAKY